MSFNGFHNAIVLLTKVATDISNINVLIAIPSPSSLDVVIFSRRKYLQKKSNFFISLINNSVNSWSFSNILSSLCFFHFSAIQSTRLTKLSTAELTAVMPTPSGKYGLNVKPAPIIVPAAQTPFKKHAMFSWVLTFSENSFNCFVNSLRLFTRFSKLSGKVRDKLHFRTISIIFCQPAIVSTVSSSLIVDIGFSSPVGYLTYNAIQRKKY